jgi:hypothetical protein
VGDGHTVIVLAIGDERPSIILAWLDQVQLAPAERAMLDLPQFARGRKRQTVGCADATGPGFSRRQIRAGKGIGDYHLRGLGCFGVSRRIDKGNGGSAGLAEVGIARGWFAVQCQAQDLPFGLVWILGGCEALTVANCKEQKLAVGGEGDLRAFLPTLPLSIWCHSTSKFSSLAEVAVALSLARASARPPP